MLPNKQVSLGTHECGSPIIGYIPDTDIRICLTCGEVPKSEVTIKSNPKEEKPAEEIERIKVSKTRLKVKLGDHWYPLIMCYVCPLCKEPLIAYWKLDGKPRVTDRVAGRALRDSGFGAYRFFEDEEAQGFEYAPNKDPKNRHYHQEKESSSYSFRPAEVIKSHVPYMELNPMASVNRLLHGMINPEAYGRSFAEGHQFVTNQAVALKFIEKMRRNEARPALADMFKVIDDINNHGKPIFLFEITQWSNMIRYSYDVGSHFKKAISVFSRQLMAQLFYGDKDEEIRKQHLTESTTEVDDE